jgi:hypothetical protein
MPTNSIGNTYVDLHPALAELCAALRPFPATPAARALIDCATTLYARDQPLLAGAVLTVLCAHLCHAEQHLLITMLKAALTGRDAGTWK